MDLPPLHNNAKTTICERIHNYGIPYSIEPRQHIKKQRHNSGNKGPSSQRYGFPAVMYGCESWIIKKAER